MVTGVWATAEDAAAAVPAPDSYEAALALAGPDEPTYCHCNRISFGEMIGCDNDDCPVEWFHLGCVGLTPETKPKGECACTMHEPGRRPGQPICDIGV